MLKLRGTNFKCDNDKLNGKKCHPHYYYYYYYYYY